MDFMATKGIEYLLCIAYLVLLVPFWTYFFGERRERRRRAAEAPAIAPALAMRSWFQVPGELHYHRGHTWAQPEGDGVFRVGLDDFAGRLVGAPQRLELPLPGGWIEEGTPAWNAEVDGAPVRFLSPLDGEVVERNHEVLRHPELASSDPYGRGWLLKVRSPKPEKAVNNLFSGHLARAWMDDAAERLSTLMGPTLGPVLQDGGVPVAGFARQIAPQRWHDIAEDLLLTA